MEINDYNDNNNYYLSKYNLLFLNIPKVASSTLWSVCAQLESGFIMKDKSQLRSFRLPVLNTSDLKEWPEVKKIAFVRNPFSRLVSTYRNKIEFGIPNFIKRNNLKPNISFAEFVEYVCGKEDCNSDRHFRSQYTFLFDNLGEPIVDYLGRLENFNEDFADITEQYNLPSLTLPRLNSHSVSDYKSYYTDELRQMVSERYKLDLELLGYDFESRAELWDNQFKNHVITPTQKIEILKYKSQKLLRIVRIKQKYDKMPKGLLGLIERKYKEYFTNYFNENLDV